MHRILRNEVSLVLRTDGVLVQLGREETVVPWDDLQQVRWDHATSSLVLERTRGAPIVVQRPRPDGRAPTGGPQMAARVMQLKRRQALNLRP